MARRRNKKTKRANEVTASENPFLLIVIWFVIVLGALFFSSSHFNTPASNNTKTKAPP
jgi:hypothetical protein